MNDEQIKTLAEKCILANPLTDGMLQTRIEAAIKEALELEREEIAGYLKVTAQLTSLPGYDKQIGVKTAYKDIAPTIAEHILKGEY